MNSTTTSRRDMFRLVAGVSLAPSRNLSLMIPEDGGTPRDPARLVRLGPAEFRIRAHDVEGNSFLKHAVARTDLILDNSGPPAEVTLHFDLSADDTRSQQSVKTLRRDYIYIQPPGGSWRRVDGVAEEWVCTIRVPAAKGATKIGLLPWYTYGDYLKFVRSLQEHPHLQKVKLGVSDGGREHWELRVTDPSVAPARKRRIFWHAREHSYESFSSYSIEGLMEFLLSPAAAEARRQFELFVHPMTNIDGVAQGYEYRAGYDAPEPRSTATGRITFGAIDRLRPEFIVFWHNWTAPRDANTLFFTDSENEQPIRRGWDLFTQRFPSPRGVGHRWQEEDDPLRRNYWFQRKMRDDILQDYAAKNYRTRIWGWEMAWWGRSVDNARHVGKEFGRAFFETIGVLDKNPPMPTEAPAREASSGKPEEFTLSGRVHAEPFLVGEFTSPSGTIRRVVGDHAGGDRWRLSFTPDEEGEWRYLLRGEGVELYQRGRLLSKRQGA